jgi:hypothetical protein
VNEGFVQYAPIVPPPQNYQPQYAAGGVQYALAPQQQPAAGVPRYSMPTQYAPPMNQQHTPAQH